MHKLLLTLSEDVNESHLDISLKNHSGDPILLHHSIKVISILPLAYFTRLLKEEFNYNMDSSTVTDFKYIILEVMGKVAYNMVVDSLSMHNLLEY